MTKPTSYKNLPAYGQAKAEVNARQSNSPQAVKTMVPDLVEAQFYQDSINRALTLGRLGLDKQMYEEGRDEQKRQFDLSLGESTRQFGSNLQFARDQFKRQRRNDNMTELLAMGGVGISIGMGYLQYKQQKNMLDRFKQHMFLVKGRTDEAKQKRREIQQMYAKELS